MKESPTKSEKNKTEPKLKIGRIGIYLAIPVALLLVINVYYLSDKVTDTMSLLTFKDVLENYKAIARVIKALQIERSHTVLSTLMPTDQFEHALKLRYSATNVQITEAIKHLENIAILDELKKELTELRKLKRLNESSEDLVKMEIAGYYTGIAKVSDWIEDRLFAQNYCSSILFTLKSIMKGMEHFSLQAAYETMHLTRTGPKQSEILQNIHKENYKKETYWTVAQGFNKEIELEFRKLERTTTSLEIEEQQEEIQKDLDTLCDNDNNIRSEVDVKDKVHYHNKLMDTQIDSIFRLEQKVIDNLSDETTSNLYTFLGLIVVSGLFVVVILTAGPFIIVYSLRFVVRMQQSHRKTINTMNRQKLKTELILHQMIPKIVADKLAGNQTVVPEYFPEATIFFSDIVGFTNISSQLQPFEVVKLLNNLYQRFDIRVDLYDVYKVETIGDAYMVASGVPRRNGNRHASEIANMALDLLNSCKRIYIPGKSETVQIRVGVHTGPCAAGIVGHKMPRYCLFGDTINTASRMESTSEAMKIQISESTFHLLSLDSRFVMVERGGTEVKGKGKLKTYWLSKNRSKHDDLSSSRFSKASTLGESDTGSQ